MGRRFAYPALGCAVLVLGCAGYLIVAGIRPGAPAVFLLLAAGFVFVVGALLVRSATALLDERTEAVVKVATGRRRKELEREKQGLLKALKELEFDHEMHKISDADYEEIAALYRARAVRVMRQLDEATLDLRGLVERDVAARKAARSPAGAAPAPAPAAKSAPGRPRCGSCETENDADAIFCKRCGARLGSEAEVAS